MYGVLKSDLYGNALQHHGILGMKWGIRRYQPYSKGHSGGKEIGEAAKKASNYSSQQRIRDRKIYGKGAEKRINKRMIKGESIQSARHNEVKRKERIKSGKAIAKQVSKGVLVVGGSAAAFKLLQKKGFSDIHASQLSETAINVGRQVINAILR